VPEDDATVGIVLDDCAKKLPLIVVCRQEPAEFVEDELGIGSGTQHAPKREGDVLRLGGVGAVWRL